MLSSNFVKNIISKDKNISHQAIITLLNSSDTSLWNELILKADFIFPFVKEKIIFEFVKNFQKNNFDTIYIFMKKYSPDFEDIVVKSLLKYADDDITDRLLEIFEKGSVDEKTYAAKYFNYINDPLALDFLKKEAYSKNVYLKLNCAKALSIFKDDEILSDMKNIILNSDDEFERLSAFEFVSIFEDEIKFVLDNLFKTPFRANIISNILDNKSLFELKNILDKDYLVQIFHILIESYPEDITLDTVIYYDIFEFIKFIQNLKTNYSKNLLLLADIKFKEFLENENYIFDLDKNTKDELRKISSLLKSYNLKTDDIKVEFNNLKLSEYNLILDIIREYGLVDKLNDLKNILKDLTTDDFNKIIGNTSEVFYHFKKMDLLDKNIVEKVASPDLKALVESYFG